MLDFSFLNLLQRYLQMEEGRKEGKEWYYNVWSNNHNLPVWQEFYRLEFTEEAAENQRNERDCQGSKPQAVSGSSRGIPGSDECPQVTMQAYSSPESVEPWALPTHHREIRLWSLSSCDPESKGHQMSGFLCPASPKLSVFMFQGMSQYCSSSSQINRVPMTMLVACCPEGGERQPKNHLPFAVTEVLVQLLMALVLL